MKIAIIGQKGIPAHTGGIEAHVSSLSTQLAQQGISVTVYARGHYTARVLYWHEGVKIVHMPSFRTKHLDAISHTFFSIMHAMWHRYDVIHIHGIGPALLTWIPALFSAKTTIVFTFHCRDYFHKKWNVFARYMLKLGEYMGITFADTTICVSKEIQTYVKEFYGKDSAYIPNGVHMPELKNDEHIQKVWGLKRHEYILCVSRLIAHKGIHYAIEAFKQIETDKKLVIVGDGAFTDTYVSFLKELAKQDSRIIFTGAQNGRMLEELYSNGFLFIQPSENEGLSIALLEALSYGLPVLSSNIAANKEAIQSYGYLFENMHVQDLKEKLEQLVKQPLQRREDARIYIARSFDWKQISDKTTSVYAGKYLSM